MMNGLYNPDETVHEKLYSLKNASFEVMKKKLIRYILQPSSLMDYYHVPLRYSQEEEE